MNKNIKLVAGLLSLLMLVGCNNTPKVDKNKTIVEKATGEETKLTTQQEAFDSFWTSQGTTLTTKELLNEISKYVLENSENWTKEDIENALEERLEKKFDEYYSDSYRKNGLFDEALLVRNLIGSGYNIKATSSPAFKETVNNMVGHKHLREFLTYDYSDLEESLTKDFYLELLKEEYILSQRATSSETYFANKKVRKVAYFSFSADTSITGNTFAQEFQNMIDNALTNDPEFDYSDFLALVTGENGIEYKWKLEKLKDLAKDFAEINSLAAGDGCVAAPVSSIYPLPTQYQDKVAEFETNYATDSTYGYKFIYTNKAGYDDKDVSGVQSKLSTYSSNDAYSIYYGYYLKQLEIINRNFLTEQVVSTDGSTLIDTTVNTAVKNMKTYKESGFIDCYETNTAVFKDGSSYYIMFAEEITDSSDAALLKEAAKHLATINSNIKNSTYYWLTSLTEDKTFKVHNQDLFDYLKENYNYGEDDK